MKRKFSMKRWFRWRDRNRCDHWVLLVIIPSKDLVLYIDSKLVEGRVFSIESHLLKAYGQYQQRSGRHTKGKRTCDWSMFQGPQQLSDWECGYFVMKNMDFII
ncbi:Ulp1 protease family, C-terminal catalytic domain-containing protein [Carex littledalei]|uniref:Ulp1 protease family, C-terminal catalytic domain-containing protein n=1 Tax=Carex littledalei TaxID=544730 RepID=A0A833VG22_9POAL|nr:Ulp1 protease family, C-terminal catalytic domain-containing protein [Carex littledalei]